MSRQSRSGVAAGRGPTRGRAPASPSPPNLRAASSTSASVHEIGMSQTRTSSRVAAGVGMARPRGIGMKTRRRIRCSSLTVLTWGKSARVSVRRALCGIHAPSRAPGRSCTCLGRIGVHARLMVVGGEQRGARGGDRGRIGCRLGNRQSNTMRMGDRLRCRRIVGRYTMSARRVTNSPPCMIGKFSP